MKKQNMYIGIASILLLVIVYSVMYNVIYYHGLTLYSLFIVCGVVIGYGLLLLPEVIFEPTDMSHREWQLTPIGKVSLLSPIWLSPIPYFLITLSHGDSVKSLFRLYVGIGIAIVFSIYAVINLYKLYNK